MRPNNKRYGRKRRKRVIGRILGILSIMICSLLLVFVAFFKINDINKHKNLAKQQSQVSEEQNELQNGESEILVNQNSYPKELVELVKKHPETKQFVLDYFENKDKDFDINISAELKSNKVPLFIQWDERWGYLKYGDTMIAINGCGPTCLSMVATYVLKTDYMNPKWMAKFSEKNGYITKSGTMWSLMTNGAKKLGMTVKEIPLDKNRVINNLKIGNPIICSVGPGDFTSEGHFIVLTGIDNGKLTINDPNSKINSYKTWDFDSIKGQIKNLWVFY